METVAPSRDPLLPKDAGDVETGGPTKEDLGDELKEGTMSWLDLINFLADPSHWIVTVLVTMVFFSTLGLLDQEIEHKDKWTFMIRNSAIALAALGLSAYSAFLAEQLKEQVRKFRTLNQKLEKNKTRLSQTAQELKVGVDDMEKELERFGKLKKQIEAFGSKVGTGFQEVFEKAGSCLNEMQKLNAEMECNILSDVAQSLEFLDDQEGLSEQEYNAFKARIPETANAPNFEEIAGGKEVASAEDIQALIETLKSRLVSA